MHEFEIFLIELLFQLVILLAQFNYTLSLHFEKLIHFDLGQMFICIRMVFVFLNTDCDLLIVDFFIMISLSTFVMLIDHRTLKLFFLFGSRIKLENH